MKLTCIFLFQKKNQLFIQTFFFKGMATEKYWGDNGALIMFKDVSVRTVEEVECSGYKKRTIEILKDQDTVKSLEF